MNNVNKIIMLHDLPKEAVKTIQDLGDSSRIDFPPDEFLSASQEFCIDLKELGYSATMMNTARITLDLLYLFLDMNHLGYDPGIAWKWFETAGVCFGTNIKMSRRILALFEMYTQEGAVNPDKYFVYKRLMYDYLPAWCKEPLQIFLDQKRREHKAASTICMYRSANTRFCQFLISEGLTTFKQVTAALLKKFNISDPHETVEGKNAYNVRIRKFLFYLAEHNYIDNYYLYEALPSACAPKTKIVQVLSKEESLVLEQYDEPGTPLLGLRNRAIALIGLKMGLRISDITSLELNQIDWKNCSIRFMQDKTDVEKVLPMPIEVGNALFQYLSYGRPKSRSKYIFITHKAPYEKVGRSVGKRIMGKAFPDRWRKLKGFHVTRRTYATQRIRNQCGCSVVANLLGHTTTDTVHKYIALDKERMRLCPISLEVAGITFTGGFRNE
jgi:integrase